MLLSHLIINIAIEYQISKEYYLQVQDIGSCKGDSGKLKNWPKSPSYLGLKIHIDITGTPLIEYISSTRPAVMVARGVLHGCIGACCSANYPSVFANLGDKEIWNFVQGKAIKINIDKGGVISAF